jgi:hypothetical protein
MLLWEWGCMARKRYTEYRRLRALSVVPLLTLGQPYAHEESAKRLTLGQYELGTNPTELYHRTLVDTSVPKHHLCDIPKRQRRRQMLARPRPTLKQAAFLFALAALVASGGLPKMVSRYQTDTMASGVWHIEKAHCHQGATLMQGCRQTESEAEPQ